MREFPPLYKRGSKGEVRVWFMELDGNRHRVVSGVQGGAETRTGWTVCEPKNVGKRNETSAEQQAAAEVAATYKKKRDRGYFDSVVDIDKVPFTKPMLAHKWDDYGHKLDYSKGVFVQPKLDGIRCIARRDGLWTRTGKPISNAAAAHIMDALAPVFERLPDIVFDGELYNHDLRDDFNTISSIVRTQKDIDPDKLSRERDLMQYHVYDLVWNRAFSARHHILTDVLRDLKDTPLRGVHTLRVADEPEVGFYEEMFLEKGYEGLIIRANTPYENKRSKNLLKLVQFQSDEFPVLDVL